MDKIAANPTFGFMVPAADGEFRKAIENHTVEYWHFAVGIVVYFGVAAIIKAMCPVIKTDEEKKAHKDPFWVFPVAILHNAFMTLYSGWTFILAIQIMWPTLVRDGFRFASCDSGMFDTNQLKMLAVLFYFSKYYEFLDTWLVQAKGRQPIYLQKYHHVGAFIVMGLLVQARAEPVWLFVVLNSFIHTIMYFYYLLTVIGIKPSWKVFITQAQLIQFVVGIALSLTYYGVDCFYLEENRHMFFALTLNNVYVLYLLYLFNNFFKSTYKKKKSA